MSLRSNAIYLRRTRRDNLRTNYQNLPKRLSRVSAEHYASNTNTNEWFNASFQRVQQEVRRNFKHALNLREYFHGKKEEDERRSEREKYGRMKHSVKSEKSFSGRSIFHSRVDRKKRNAAHLFFLQRTNPSRAFVCPNSSVTLHLAVSSNKSWHDSKH